MLVDTHCHLSSGKFRDDLEDVIKNAFGSGVDKIIIPTTNLKDAISSLKIAKKFPNIYVLTGMYPGEASKASDWKVELAKIIKLTKKEKVVGIGEIGLDYYWNERNKELENEVFQTQMQIAAEEDLPVAIHNRSSEKELMEVIGSMDKIPKGQMHCWSGSEEFLRFALEHGFYISYCGNITYPGNVELRKLLSITPLERLLLETDSPYLPPQGKRGERNEPINVKIIANFIADIKNITLDKLLSVTGDNVKSLYNI